MTNYEELDETEKRDFRNAIRRGLWLVVIGLFFMVVVSTLAAIFRLGIDFRHSTFLIGVLFVVVGCVYLLYTVLAGNTPVLGANMSKERLEGSYIERLNQPQNLEGVPIGNAVMPRQAEPLHTLIEGAPGTGKTQILKRMVAYIRERGDTVVVVDSNYDMHRDLARAGDIIVSPFDDDAHHWLPQNEVRTSTDWDALAQSFIGDGQGNAQQWNQMAKAFFAATARGYHAECKKSGETFDHRELFYLLTQAPAEMVAPFLKGSAASALGDNEKGLQNVRMTFFDTLKSWEYLQDGKFSFRQWVERGLDGSTRPSIFIPYKTRDLPVAKNLISCWLDQIITSAIDGGENRDNRVWLIIDELSGLGEIAGLKQAVAQLRKTGFCVVVGIQAMEQVEDIYGRNGAISITSSLGNKVILRTTDAHSAERQSRLIGDARYSITQQSHSIGQHSSTNTSTREDVQRVILASEIMSLPDLTAIVHWAGSDCWYLTNVPVFQVTETQGKVQKMHDNEIQKLQNELHQTAPIQPENFHPEANSKSWATVDTLLQKIGGKDWDGARFKNTIIENLGHSHGNQNYSKLAKAYETARQLLIKTTDRTALEQAAAAIQAERERDAQNGKNEH